MVKVKGVLSYRAMGLDLKALLGARRYRPTLMFADSLKKMALCFANVCDITVTKRVSIYYERENIFKYLVFEGKRVR